MRSLDRALLATVSITAAVILFSCVVLAIRYQPDREQQQQRRQQQLVAQPRGPGRPRLLLRYTACMGLINQQYSHIAAFSLAAALGAELVLPPAICRDSFEHYFHTNRSKNEMAWAPFPTEGLLDVEGVVAAWARAGITVHRVGCAAAWLPGGASGRRPAAVGQEQRALLPLLLLGTALPSSLRLPR